MRYLISAPRYSDSLYIAKEKHISPADFCHITQEGWRQQTLAGRKVESEDQLIGPFSDEERFFLYGRFQP